MRKMTNDKRENHTAQAPAAQQRGMSTLPHSEPMINGRQGKNYCFSRFWSLLTFPPSCTRFRVIKRIRIGGGGGGGGGGGDGDVGCGGSGGSCGSGGGGGGDSVYDSRGSSSWR
ncbi:hypothetical protein PoB_004474200 [Plakobranchus ocellatus]|uniref:Uncharacterized protein n=1 Tax=Plakobranchus ocellatus TaxID=259542 RepID=A0AAV4BG68_9GAST|nr:hypothetical protein PoB_004474200 [Plakobranchus ocellatus]